MNRRWRHGLRAVCGACVASTVVAFLPEPIAAQQCDRSVKPVPGELGYKKRDYGCEGMYIGLQSAPLGVQVVSFVWGAFRYDPSDEVLSIRVGEISGSANPVVRVIGRPRQANLHWAFDGEARLNRPLYWDLRKVVKVVELGSENIGMYGVTSRTGGLGGPIFVPLGFGPPYERSDSLELIVRIPAAAELCWLPPQAADVPPPSDGCALPWRRPAPLLAENPDGYFRILFARPSPGESKLGLRWRPRGRLAHGETRLGDPVYLSILIPTAR